ncbi:unnamed protein product, partial [Mesorhabditis belari]|uniref:Thioredoxin domain-containing protein 9 n=1 Tax=Mesorhabditis belari TaxID=2138241 RepID=A0AAF3J1D0_9BILA
MQEILSNQLMNAVKIVEEQVEQEIKNLENLDEDDLEVIRRQRAEKLKRAQQARNEMGVVGHGKYEEVTDEKEFFEATKKSKKVVCLFYLDSNERCKIVDKHFEILAVKHFTTRFIKVNAEKVHFLVTRLNIRMIPTIAICIDQQIVDYIRGFDDLGGIDDFKTEVMERRLAQTEVIEIPKPIAEAKGPKKIIRSTNKAYENEDDCMTGQDSWGFGMNPNPSNNSYKFSPQQHLDRPGIKRPASGGSDSTDEPRAKRKIEQVSARFGRINLDRHSPFEHHSDDEESTMEDSDPIAFVEEPPDDPIPNTYKEVHLDNMLKQYLNNARHSGDFKFMMNNHVRPDALVPYHHTGHPIVYPSIQEILRDEEWHHLSPQTSPPLITFPFEDEAHSDDQNREDTETISSASSPIQIVEVHDPVEVPMDYEAMELE